MASVPVSKFLPPERAAEVERALTLAAPHLEKAWLLITDCGDGNRMRVSFQDLGFDITIHSHGLKTIDCISKDGAV